MPRCKKFIAVIGCLLPLIVFAQEQTPKPKVNYTFGYYGEMLTHAGATAGAEYRYAENGKHTGLLAVNAGMYVHVRNSTAAFVRVQWGQRITWKSGLFADQFMGLGYMHQFTHGGNAYEILPNGSIVNSPNSGRAQIMPSVTVGTGYDLSRKTKLPFALYLRPELFWQAPFNGYFLTHIALNTGIIFTPLK